MKLIVSSLLLLVGAGMLHAQLLPPIYRPLSDEQTALHRARLDSLEGELRRRQSMARTFAAGAERLDGGEEGGSMLRELRGEVEAVASAERIAVDQAKLDERMAAFYGEQGALLERRADSLAGEAARHRVAADAILQQEDDESGGEVQRLLTQASIDSSGAASARTQAAALRADQVQSISAAITARSRALEAQVQREKLQRWIERLERESAAEREVAQGMRGELSSIEREIVALRDSVALYRGLLDELRAQQDRAFLPVRSSADGRRFYGDNSTFFRNVIVSGSGGGFSLNTEVAATMIGPIRYGVNILASDPTDARREGEGVDSSVVHRLFAGGGNLTMHAMYPILYSQSSDHALIGQILAKGSGDLPRSYSAPFDSAHANVDIGFDLFGNLLSDRRDLRLFVQGRGAFLVGSDRLMEELGMPGKRSFPYAQVTAGIELNRAVNIVASAVWAPDPLSLPWGISVQVAPR